MAATARTTTSLGPLRSPAIKAARRATKAMHRCRRGRGSCIARRRGSAIFRARCTPTATWASTTTNSGAASYCAYAHHDLSRTTLKKLAEFFQTDHLHSTLCDDPVLSRVLLLFNFRVTRRWRGADSRSSQNAIDATYLLTSDSFRAEQLLPPLQDAQHEAQLRELGELQEGVHRRRLVRRDLFRAARDRVGDAPLPRRVNSRGNINSLSTQSSPQRREGAHLQRRAHKFPIYARSAVASTMVACGARRSRNAHRARPAGVPPR